MITQKEMKAALYLAEGMTALGAAKKSGMSYATLRRRIKDPYFAEHLRLVKKGLAEGIAEGIEGQTKENIKAEIAKLDMPLPDRAKLLAKLWEFACVDPQLTRGNTDSQRAAVNEMWAKMGYDHASPDNPESTRPDVYRAAWMNTPQ